MLNILRQLYSVGAALDARFPDESKSKGVAIRSIKITISTAIAHNANLDGLGNGIYRLYIPQRCKLLAYELLEGGTAVVTIANSAFSIDASGALRLTQTTAPLEQGATLEFLLLEQAG